MVRKESSPKILVIIPCLILWGNRHKQANLIDQPTGKGELSYRCAQREWFRYDRYARPSPILSESKLTGSSGFPASCFSSHDAASLVHRANSGWIYSRIASSLQSTLPYFFSGLITEKLGNGDA
jgi:hypothetical protein